jgi:hypothetical protein
MGLRPIRGLLANRCPSSPEGNCDWQAQPFRAEMLTHLDWFWDAKTWSEGVLIDIAPHRSVDWTRPT